MVAAGCSQEQMLAVARAHEAEVESKLIEKRAKDAERQRKSRLSRRVTVTPCDSALHAVTEAPNARAPAHGLELTSLDSKILSKENPPKGGQKKGSRRTQLAPDAQPDERDRAAAQRAGMSDGTFRNEWQKFRARHVAKAEAMANWHAAWVQWIANWTGYGAKQVEQANARAGPNGSGNGFSGLIDKLRGQQNERTNQNIKDITPEPSEPRTGGFAARISEPTGKSSGGGEVLDFRPASPDLRRSAAFGSEAARTFDWPEPLWGTGGSGAID